MGLFSVSTVACSEGKVRKKRKRLEERAPWHWQGVLVTEEHVVF